MAQNTLIIPTTAPLSGLALVNYINNANLSLAGWLQGPNAPTLSGLALTTLSGVVWHDTTNNQLKVRDQADTTWILVGTFDETNKIFTPANAGSGGGGGGGSTSAVSSGLPSGRLTTQSGTPVATADSSGTSTVYYTPFKGNTVPIYSGTVFNNYTFSQLTLTLTASAHLAGKLYDVFVALSGGAVVIGTGPAWSSASSRGSGAGTTQTGLVNGLSVNTNIITLTNGATTYTNIAASQATYVGTIYTPVNGQTAFMMNPNAAAGGTNTIVGVYNYYNQVKVTARCSDSTASWSYATNTWRAANGSSNNRIYWVDGVATSNVHVEAFILNTAAAAGVAGAVGIGFNSLITPSGLVGQAYGTSFQNGFATWVNPPAFGLNWVNQLENAFNGSTTFTGGALNMGMYIDLTC